MSQTALNLIAISVFLMTLTSLLAPLLNLSPAVPAIATFVVLGIATIDSFSWEGKGGNIFIDWLANFSPQHRERIIHHEAGHFLVAYLLNIPIKNYTLSAWEAWKNKQSGQGGVSFDDEELKLELEQGKITPVMLERYCTVWMAGIAAENLVYQQVEGGADDKNQLENILHSLGFSHSHSQQKQSFCALQAKTLLEKNWSAYQTLVKAMADKNSVDDCIIAIKGKLIAHG
ncbi:MAG: ATP-dependent Zn protease [Cyanobacteria bacterium P01_A01_bin.45]